MASNSSSDHAGKGKRILEKLQQKASELSSLLGNDVEKTPEGTACLPNRSAGPSVSRSSYMPTFRRQFCTSSNISTFRGKGKGKGKGKNAVQGPFMRDVILLPGPDVTSVPRQAKRVWLTENGLVISGLQLQKEWSACVVEASLRGAFDEKIPPLVDFEILMPVHTTLVKPTLAPGQDLNGVMVHRVFKEKPIYLRPFEEICDSSTERSNKRYRVRYSKL